mgnify:CR=1 FL=1|tara:strand:+ start:7371 stop:7595 length:225 start_codon:yes stop_codon:yes gene_type:complete
MAVKSGVPKKGAKNARNVTRVENQITGIPRSVSMFTERKTGDVKFLNSQGKTYWFDTMTDKENAVGTLNDFWVN